MRNSPWSRARPAGRHWIAALCLVSVVTAGVSAQVAQDWQKPLRPAVSTSNRGAVRTGLPPDMTDEDLQGLRGGPIAGGTIADVGVICSEATGLPAACQLPTGAQIGFVSDASYAGGPIKAAERFANDTGIQVDITTICWWGNYEDFGASQDCSDDNGLTTEVFNIKFLSDNQDMSGCPKSLPGTRIRSFPDISFTKAPTGNNAGNNLEFEYTATLPSTVPVADGACVWIEIQADTGDTASPNCLWAWLTSPTSGDDFAMVDSDSNGVYDFDEDIPYDFAFCVDFVLGDSSPCDVAPLAICEGGTGDCGAPNGTPGCEDACCASIVAEFDPTCCTDAWTFDCAELAIDAGCAVWPECQDDNFCQRHEINYAFRSVTGVNHAADDFTPAVSGDITDICWYGIYHADTPGTDDFTVTYYEDSNGLPGAVVASYNVGTPAARQSTGEEFPTVDWTSDVYEYSESHPAVSVTAGGCYWVSITNASPLWGWLAAEDGPWVSVDGVEEQDPPREGNGRYAADNTPADDWTNGGWGLSKDRSFCLGIELTVPACDFLTPYDTGPHWWVAYDPQHGGNLTKFQLGWASGDLVAGPGVDDQRRSAQPLALPTVPDGKPSWRIQQIIVEGFEPAAGSPTNDFLNFEILTRTALDVPPTPDDLIAGFYQVSFDAALDLDLFTRETGVVPVNLNLPAGDYWLTMWPSNSSGGTQVSNVAWYTNAFDLGDLVNNKCTDAMPPPNHPGGWIGCLPDVPGMPNDFPCMLRAHRYPDPGFGAYTLDPITTLSVNFVDDPDPDPADLYNAAFRVRGIAGTCGDGVVDEGEECDDGNNTSGDGCNMNCVDEPGEPCCPDCADPPAGDGFVNVTDFLFMLGQWGADGTCNCAGDDLVVNVTDFLFMLGFWGPCPTG